MRRALVTAVAVLFAVAACSSSSSSTPSTTTTTTTTSTTTSTSTAATVPNKLERLPMSTDVRNELVAAFAAANHIDPSFVGESTPGSEYLAFDPETSAYWALETFKPSASVKQNQGSADDPTVKFQDGPQVFRRLLVGSWEYVTSSGGPPCPPTPPQAVIDLWKVGSPGACPG